MLGQNGADINRLSNSRFARTVGAPCWEGLVIPEVTRQDQRFQVYTTEPVGALKPFIQSIWWMNWNLPKGTEIRSIVVPTPCHHLMGLYSPDLSALPLWHGILNVKIRGEFRILKGQGQSFGIEFRPGGLFPFLNGPLGEWGQDPLPLHKFLSNVPPLPRYSQGGDDLEIWLSQVEAILVGQLSALQSHHLAEITRIIQVMRNQEVSTVDNLLLSAPISKRTLQRIFMTEVGLSPREVLRIVRFNRSIQAMNEANPDCLADFALESGFFDQPHMINEFRKLVDTPPTQFKKYW